MATVISKIGIKDSTGSGYDTRDIGAKGQNVEVGYDADGKVIIDVDKQTPTTTKTLTTVLQENDNATATLNTEKAPNNHRWTDGDATDYGKADATHYGHVRPGTGLYIDSDAKSATYGSTNVSFAENKEVAENKAVQANDTRLSDDRKNPNAVTFSNGTNKQTYDGSAALTVSYNTIGSAPAGHTSVKADASTLGHVTVSTGLTSTNGALSVAYGTTAGTACAGNDSRLSDNRTPKTHASTTAGSYGAGTGSQYGHVMLTDTYSVTSPSAATNGAATSIAASAYALQQAYNTLNSNKLSYPSSRTFVISLGSSALYGLPGVATGSDRIHFCLPTYQGYSKVGASFTSGTITLIGSGVSRVCTVTSVTDLVLDNTGYLHLKLLVSGNSLTSSTVYCAISSTAKITFTFSK